MHYSPQPLAAFSITSEQEESLLPFQQTLNGNDRPVVPEEMTEYCVVPMKAAQPEDRPMSLAPSEHAPGKHPAIHFAWRCSTRPLSPALKAC